MDQTGHLLIISQVYIPDPAAVGQYLAEVATEIAKRGRQVTVLTADRGYDNPDLKYPRCEECDGVNIRRLPLSSFGKSSITLRLLAGFSFIIQAFFYGLFSRRVDRILVSTSPPVGSLVALVLAKLKRVPLIYWVMDINPDQVVELGKLARSSMFVRTFDWLNRQVLKNASRIITLDQDMAERLKHKADLSSMRVIPPWPLIKDLKPTEAANNPFRIRYKLGHKLVVMYSGNHSMANPLYTLIEVAKQLKDVKELVFMFVGGGVQKNSIEAVVDKDKLENVISLPYQPLADLKNSLSAADIHVVSMGDNLKGVLHPSKIYGALAVGKPVLALSSEDSFITRMIKQYEIGWQVTHGDVSGLKRILEGIIEMPEKELEEMGKRARQLGLSIYNKDRLLTETCDVISNVE